MTTGAPLLTSLGQAKSLVNKYMDEVVQAKRQGMPVVWHPIYFPRELVEAYDVVAIPGEWYSATSGPGQGIDLLETAEACGFPHELCSYSRMCLGSMVANRGFLGEFPKPDVVIGLEGACNIEANWFEFIARYYNAPFFMMDYPPVNVYEHREDAENDALDYFVQQAYRLIDFMEQTLGQRPNEEKLIKACVTHHRNAEIWAQIPDLWHAVPSPISLRSLISYLPARMGLACRPEGVELSLALRDELAQRVKDGVSGIGDERVRLYWHGLVPYYHLRLLRDFERKGAAIVGGSYFEGDIMGGWSRKWSAEPKNIEECLREIGKNWITSLDYLGLRYRVERAGERVHEANVDGLIIYLIRICRRQSKGELEVRTAMKKAVGLPTLTLEGSPSDPRDFSLAGVEHAVTAFLEQVMAHKERRMKNTSKG